MHDLVIRGGTVVDGTGALPRAGDVAVDGGKISAVGANLGPGKREIDAKGKLVTPGFVDVHTHYDAQATWDPYMTPSAFHGCTTIVMGNCGVGFAPVKPDRHQWLIGLMEGVEDIPGAALSEGLQWNWESYPEYMDALDAFARVIDVGCQVTHGALRGYVMGDRGAKNEQATADDIAAMYRLASDGMKAGALGISMSRTLLHKALDGEFVPGTFAGHDEVFGIGQALVDAGHGVFQFACEHADVPKELVWMREWSKRTGRTVSLNLSQLDPHPDLWKQVLALVEDIRKEGVDVVAQAAGRSIGVIMGLELTAHPLFSCPTYLGIHHMPFAEKVAELQKPDVRAAILADETLDLGDFANLITRSFHKMFPVDGDVDYEPTHEASVAAIAQRMGKSPREVAYDALMKDDGRALMYFPLFNYSDGSLDNVRTLQMSDATRMGLSDAGAHCGAICDGGMPTFMLTHWTRDRKRGAKMPLERIIHRQTQQTAQLFGLYDRGVLAPGYKADVNVIDYDNLGFENPKVVYDLPAGGRRLLQKARGYSATIVSGQIILENDQFTGVLPGRLIRGPQKS